MLKYMDVGSLNRLLRQRRGPAILEAALAEVAVRCVVGLA